MKNHILRGAGILLLWLLSVTLSANPPGSESQKKVSGRTGNTETKTRVKEKADMEESTDQLLIVWTSGDPDVAHKMVFMYAYNAQKNGWWDQVTLLIWGPSQKLSSEDKSIQEALKKMQEEGVELLACKGCADQYGICEKLEEEGVTVKYTGTYLTDFIKSGKKVVTF